MNLEFSEEQRLLRDSVDRFVAQRYGFNDRKPIAESPGRCSAGIWDAIASFGWLALPIPESRGGLGGSAVDVGILMEGLGKGLVLEPVLSSSILAGALIADHGNDAQCTTWLPGIIEGTRRVAFAHLESGADPFAGSPGTRALKSGAGWRLDGAKAFVLDAPQADLLLVSATLDGVADASGAPASGLFAVSRDTPGLRVRAFETQDDRLAAHLELEGLRLPDDALLGGVRDAGPTIARALDRALAALCAEAVGCMQVLLEATLAHTKTRVQFGAPIAVNQVLRHRMVDMAIQCEEARAIALRAALVCDASAEDPAARARAVSGARLKVGDASRFVAQAAVQLHGAMGVTDELNIGAYFKRLLCIETSWGTRAEHLARCIAARRTNRG